MTRRLRRVAATVALGVAASLAPMTAPAIASPAVPSAASSAGSTPASTAGSTAAPSATERAAPGWYRGHCQARTPRATTVVVDFQDLGARGQHPGRTLVRCALPRVRDDGSLVKRTGLRVLRDAAIRVQGTRRWGTGFACRLEGRPAARERLAVPGNPGYTEACIDTPPASAYWSYWHANGRGQSWRYSKLGLRNRFATPGGYEGWSFSLGARPGSNPRPGVRPVRP